MIMGMCIGCSPYNAEQSVITQAIAVLRRFGTDVHVYLPGVGMLNGLTAGNHLDSAGTTDAEIDGPVGLVLDAAGGLGVELVTNGDFSAGVAGWSRVQPTAGMVDVVSGAMRLYSSDGTVASFTPTVANLVINATYRVTFNASIVSGSASFRRLDNGAVVQSVVSGENSFVFKAEHQGWSITRNSACDISFDNISVREVTGIHAQQPTTASKPILRRGAVSTLFPSHDVSAAGWLVESGATKLGGTAISLLADYSSRVKRNVAGFTIGQTVTAAFVLSSSVDMPAYVAVFDEGGVYGGTNRTITVTPTQTLFVVTRENIQQTQVSARVISMGVAGVVNVHAAALFQGTYTAQQIQALGGIPLTTTAPASTALGPQYWQFDGSNDSLSLGSVPFQQSDDHFVCAAFEVGALPSSGSQSAIFGVSSTSSTTPLCAYTYITDIGNAVCMWRDDSGAVSQRATGAGVIVGGAKYVITIAKIGSSYAMWMNGVLIASSIGALGATTVNVANIGALVRTSTTFYLNGKMHYLKAVKGTLTEPDRILIEKYAANIAGVQI